MSDRPSIGEAADLLRAQLGMGQMSNPATTEDTWAAFVRFGRMRFSTANSPDADGLLFQYGGVYAFDGPEAFSLDLTRQFEVLGESGDHDHFVQVHCELAYEPVPALTALGAFNSWFFHDSGEDLGRWLEALTDQDAWTVIREQRPVKVAVRQEAV
ncbi:hypothetical protein [Streptomyces sp. NPDC002580]|uniref:hypothetical protein n=1 Tax=Streptomyces sp. NPDC002580 TaxID=3364653 RepID=UPI003688595E